MHTLKSFDPDIYDAIVGETRRHIETLEMIASENFVSHSVIKRLRP